ncbi:hypothetical protein URH17368_2913 [Alicyclobacillus hesperidum URH17-3-68]|nr:hypothetical protein URH17368_2913 [Alicyclobacillus hesperidum URH17-3-68]
MFRCYRIWNEMQWELSAKPSQFATWLRTSNEPEFVFADY